MHVEGKTKTGSRSKYKARKRAIQAVLEEQDIQREENLPDHDFLSNIYRSLTGTSVIKALSLGIKDQKAMLDSLDEKTRMVYASRIEKIRQQQNNDVGKRCSSQFLIPNNGSTSPRSVICMDVHNRQQQNEIETYNERVSTIQL